MDGTRGDYRRGDADGLFILYTRTFLDVFKAVYSLSASAQLN
jgi:hypothetical protein